mgnify:CR=1 FL=1
MTFSLGYKTYNPTLVSADLSVPPDIFNMATTTLLGITLTLTPTALSALRIAPLLSSTASLTHAYIEWLTNSAFLVPAPVDSSLSRFLLGPDAPPKAASQSASAASAPDAELERAKQLVVPEWFTNFFNTGVISVIGFNSVTLLSASLNLLFSEGLEASKVFYQAGLAAAVGHYAFVPLVGRSVRALTGLAAGRAQGGKTEGLKGKREGEDIKAVEWVREWVGYHMVRMSTVDALAWSSFAWGVVRAVTVTV